MNRIVLIGNGFDLAHGLKTSYKDFIEWLMELKFNLIFERGFYFEDEDVSFHNTEPFIRTFDDFRSKFFIEKSHITVVRLDGSTPKQTKVKYKNSLMQVLINHHFINGWADVESLYYEKLNELISSEKSTNDDIRTFQNEFQRIINYLEDYLQTIDTAKPEVDSRYLILETLNEPIKLKELSNEYLSSLDNEKISTDIDIDKGLLVDFNYTHTTNHYIPQNYNLIHIHGELNNSKNPIIFGFGDELDDNYSKIEKSKFKNDVMRFIKSVNYLKNDNYRNLLNFAGIDKFQIYLFGHSCGNTDRTLLNTLFEHENCVSIKPFYYIKNDISKETSYFEISSNITRNFKDKKLLRDRVVNEKYCSTL